MRLILALMASFLMTDVLYGQAVSARRVGAKYTNEQPKIPRTGPFSEAQKGPPLPLRDLGRSHKVVVAYFVPRDCEPVPEYKERAHVMMTFMNQLYRDAEQTWRPRTDQRDMGLSFVFDPEDRESVFVLPVLGELNNSTYIEMAKAAVPGGNSLELGNWIYQRTGAEVIEAYKEVNARLHLNPIEHTAFIVFREGSLGPITHCIGGMVAENPVGQVGPDCIHPDRVSTTVDGYLEMMRARPLHVGATVAGCAHELAHGFGVPHDKVSSNYYVMSTGAAPTAQNFSPHNSPGRPKMQFSKGSIGLLKRSLYMRSPVQNSIADARVSSR